MSNPFADTLHLSVRRSNIHRALVVALHLLALAVLVILALARPWLWIGVPAVLAAGWLSERRAALRRAGCIKRLRWQGDDVWRWQRVDGRWCAGRRVYSFCLGDQLVVLGLREDHRRLATDYCVLFRDTLSARAHRQLRARLTIAPEPGAAGGAAS